MDSGFLGLSLVFIIIGVAGIGLFYGPMNSAGDSCYCLIPSPEPGAAQGTASIFLVLGIIFLPIGIMKGGFPSFRRVPVGMPQPSGAVGPALPPGPISSGRLFGLGILLLVVGVDALLVPGLLVLKSSLLTGAGGVVAVLGALALYIGSKKRPG